MLKKIIKIKRKNKILIFYKIKLRNFNINYFIIYLS